MDRILEVRNLSYAIGSKDLFRNLNLEIYAGDAYALWGPGGSGRSSLLRLVTGLLPLAEGSVRIDGIDLAAASRETLRGLRLRMGVVFQEGALLNNMSIYDNIALPLRYHTDLPEGEVGGRVGKIMDLFEIDRENERAIPAQVSTGVRKRAAFARALILNPPLLFLDEPALGLEKEAALQIVQILKGYRERHGATLFSQPARGLRPCSWPTASGF